MKIDILTPVSKGGPYFWGKHLVRELRIRGYDARHIHSLWGLFRTMFHTDADIVHTSVPLWLRFWFKPVILTVKGDYRIEKRLWRLFYPLSICYSNTRTCPTRYLKHKLGLKSARVIPNAVSVERFGVRREHKPRNAISIVTMSKFKFKDKSDGLCFIASALRSLNHNFTWTIIGGGEYLESTKRKVLDIIGDASHINFLGFIDNPETELPKHDIFAYYSVHDNFPHAIIEAMACGLPVVTNNFGATSEIINHRVDGFIEDDCIRYSAALDSLIKDWQLRKRMGNAGRSSVLRNFSWNKVVEQYLNIYKKLG